MSTPLGPRFREAFDLAATLHAGQVRKGTTIPYIAHLLAVTSLVLEHGGDEDQAIAALLHDAVEDQGGAPVLAEIRRRFGDGVAQIVDDLSDTDETPKPPWEERKRRYLAHVPQTSARSRLVGIADKLHNARTILADYQANGDDVWDRFKGGRAGTLWYYRALLDAYGRQGPMPMLDVLTEVVAQFPEA